MDGQSNAPRAVRDDELDSALNLENADDLDELNIRNQRVARILDYEESAVARRDPFAAIIGMGNADMQRMCEYVGAAILERLDCGTKSIEEIREVSPEMRLLVKMRKSIETDLALHLLEGEQQPTAYPHRRSNNDLEIKPVSRRSLPRR
jgi:hypothetical protein